jgi:4-amino-4-deoxy-L-arabinose transferase-like glycosyltransferase
MRERAMARWRAMGSPRTRRVLLVVLFVAFVLRVGWVAYAGVPPRFASDPEAYLLQGETIARGHGYVNPLVDIENVTRRAKHEPLKAASPASFYPPGYSVFAAGVIWLVWHTPIPDPDLVRAIGYVQAILGTLTVLLAFEIARKVFDSRVAIVTAAIVALYPNFVTTTATLQLETFFIFLTLATFIVLLPVATRERPRLRRLVAGGAMVGIVALVRPTIALLLVALLAVRMFARLPRRETLRSLGIVALVMVAAVAPWTIRNQLRLHAFVPISTGIGPTVCVSRNDEATGALDTGIIFRNCEPHRDFSSPAALDVATNNYGTRHAIDWVIAHPQPELRMWFWRTYLAFREDSSGIGDIRSTMNTRWADVLTSASDAASYVVLAFGAIGFVVVVRRRTRGRLFVAATAVALSSVPIILYGDPRYRVPAEPFFAILAAAGLVAALTGAMTPERRAPLSVGEARRDLA